MKETIEDKFHKVFSVILKLQSDTRAAYTRREEARLRYEALNIIYCVMIELASEEKKNGLIELYTEFIENGPGF